MSFLYFNLLLLVSSVLATNAGDRACASISSRIGAKFVQTPSSPSFNTSVNAPLDLANNALRPACVVVPQNTSHVSTAMKAIYQEKSSYAVLSGGHSAMKGWDAVSGGVLIYFTDMKAATYDATTDTITLQPGIRAAEAITALAPFGVAPPVARAADVGSSFLLGGGISFLSPSLGWGADSYKELDVVLVDGTVVTATATNQYQDLFKALKGGANRFGIVTRYEVYAFHSGTATNKSWTGGSITYPSSSLNAVMRATSHFTKNVKDPKATIFVTLVDLVTSGVITAFPTVNLFYNGKSLPPNVFDEFLSIPATNNSIGPLSYADIILNTFPTQNAHGSTYLYGSSTIAGGDDDAFLNAVTRNLNFTQVYKNQLANTALTFTPIQDSQILAGRARGGNVIDAPLSGGYAVVQISQTLVPGLVDVPQDIADGKQTLLQQIKPVPGLPLFINECDATQNVFATYGQYEFLKKTYQKYDPTRFNVDYTGGPIGL
ncbi:hypothetical protein B0H11DRAFT_2272290 [Mycena galericulata]|nr:hypothetical protein B0H11DRAFT_2272290 [Mycena galericulata]